MRKTTLAASILIVAAVLFSVIYLQSSEASPDATGSYVKFHVSGCDNNCNPLSYCIDGGQVYTVNTCAFGWSDCSPGTHTICVGCGRKSGSTTFTCYGGWVQDVYVTVQPNGPVCACTKDKK